MRTNLIALVLAAAFIAPAEAGHRAGVTMPDTMTVAGKPLTLNGIGLREATFLNIDVYVAGLYLERVSSDPNHIIASSEVKVLVLRFVRDVDRSDIVKAWNEGFHNNATVKVATLAPLIERLDSWMGAFSKGDTLVFRYVPGEGLGVDINGVHKGLINSDDFARSLFAIWLGPKPPGRGLKKDLLGSH